MDNTIIKQIISKQNQLEDEVKLNTREIVNLRSEVGEKIDHLINQNEKIDCVIGQNNRLFSNYNNMMLVLNNLTENLKNNVNSTQASPQQQHQQQLLYQYPVLSMPQPTSHSVQQSYTPAGHQSQDGSISTNQRC